MKQKKLLSFLLAAIMLVIMLPNAALAAEPTTADKFTFDKATGTITGITDKSLTEIVIPESIDGTAVTAIGDNAFHSCSNLSSITIPNSVETIGFGAFFCCDNLSSVTIPDSVTSIEGSAFRSCSNLSSITIPNSVKSIGISAFCDCSNLSSVTIPDSVETIGSSAFQGCRNLSSVTLPSSVKSIEDYAFYNCMKLSSVTIPSSVKSIGISAFYNCIKLSSVTIPNSVKAIEDYAFHRCSNLSRITIPDSVKTIEDGAFRSCSNLSSITIPSSVKTIGVGAFQGCSSLSSITIPDSVESIGGSAFQGCSNLSSITIPSSVKTIGGGAFSYCSILSSITIPDSVETIGNGAFQGCSSLSSITIPDSVKTIEDGVFKDCSNLSSITIPNSVKTIGDDAFSNCRNLSSITIPGGVETIGYNAFGFCSNLSSVTIPSSVESIGGYAFGSCENLSSVTIPNSVETIGDSAFCYCTKLSKVYYPGTQEQWNTIALGNANTELDGKVIYIPVTYNKALSLIYDDNEKNLYTTENDDVAIYYYDESGTMLNTAPKNSGIYTVKVSWAEQDITELEIDTFKIKKATPTENPDKKTTARVLKGKTLADASVTEGEILGINNAVLDGTFAWEDETKVIDASGTASMIFTPDNTNYAPLTVNVDVTAYQSSSGGGSLSSVSSHTVRFNTDGGSSVKTQSVVSGGKATEPTESTKDGFTFDGWYSDSELTAEYDFDTKVTTNITLYAKWVEKQIEEPSDDSSDNNTGDEQKPTTDKPINPFVDVKENDWFFDGVGYVNKNNLMFGVTDTEFAPSMTLTRGMLVTVLYRTEGEPEVESDTLPFADVAADSYYADAVIWAKQNGIVSGINETEFAPDENITREQIAAIIYRFAQYKGIAPTGAWAVRLDYADLAEIADYAVEGVMYCTMKSIMQGKDNNMFAPKDNATRAEIAVILQRFIENNK